MKMEFVKFYPLAPSLKKNRHKNTLGTVHVYLIEEEMSLRGILVLKSGKGIFFSLPHFSTINAETGEKVSYPHVRFTNDEKHKNLINFLHQHVKPIIKDILRGVESNNVGVGDKSPTKQKKTQQKAKECVSSNLT